MAKQLDVLFRHFATGGTITTYEATVRYGICRLSERCRELCARGWDIQGETEKSAEGKYFKRYWLNPEQLNQIKREEAAGLGGLAGQPPLCGVGNVADSRASV